MSETTSPFTNAWSKRATVAAILLGQSFNLTPFGASLGARYLIANDLGVPNDAGQVSWIAAAFSLTTGSFVLVGGRLGDVYGAKIVWLCALAWSFIWNLVSSFARSPAFFDACRGLTGIGAGIMLPTAIGMLAQTFPPGKRRNIAFGMFGALAPFSAAGGSVFEVLAAQLASQRWIWWLHAIKNAFTFSLALIAMPNGFGKGHGGAIDIVGAFLGVAGLILFNFAFNFMSFGAWLYYYTQFLFKFRGATPLQVSAYVSPITTNGFIAACLSAFLISRVPAQFIICAGLLAVTLANITLMTARPPATYWSSTFVSAFFAPFAPDMTFTAAQLVASNTVKPSEQGVAGSLVGTALNYGLALGIGLAATVETHTNAHGMNPLRGIRGALYFACGLAVLGLVVAVAFVRVPKDLKEGYEDGFDVSSESSVNEEWEDVGKQVEKDMNFMFSIDFGANWRDEFGENRWWSRQTVLSNNVRDDVLPSLVRHSSGLRELALLCRPPSPAPAVPNPDAGPRIDLEWLCGFPSSCFLTSLHLSHCYVDANVLPELYSLVRLSLSFTKLTKNVSRVLLDIETFPALQTFSFIRCSEVPSVDSLAVHFPLLRPDETVTECYTSPELTALTLYPPYQAPGLVVAVRMTPQLKYLAVSNPAMVSTKGPILLCAPGLV
ncbi:MFS general substrate transporter [Pseudohyphozyma bogoriensis]|nr:MFS general substrate transporter [Pseudohyphozyma bogoriensis]